MPSVIIVGGQWGDEGKGKIIDILTSKAKHVVRAQGGNNAGHTVMIGEKEYKLHLTPAGILQSHTQCYLGAGTVIDPEILIQEISTLKKQGIQIEGRLWISPAAHVIFSYHRVLDLLIEQKKGKRSIGTTGRGIGPCYADKANRMGIRMGEFVREDLFSHTFQAILQIKNEEISKLYGAPPLQFDELYPQYQRFAQVLAPYIAPVDIIINKALDVKDNTLFEGAQGTFLDITSGTYPFVTSSNTIAAGICVGAGVGPSRIDHTIGVLKAYTTRVGNGPFPTEIHGEEIFLDHHQAREYGTTTGRKRRIGWFDAVIAKKAVWLNGLQSIALTKLDILDSLKSIKICVGYQINGKRYDDLPTLIEEIEKIDPIYETVPGWQTPTKEITSYEKLPENAKNYIKVIETLCKTPVNIISLGPERERTIILKDIFGSKEKLS